MNRHVFSALILAASLCAGLTSCQPASPPGGASSAPEPSVPLLTRYELPGEGARSLTLEGRWELSLEDTPNPRDCSQTTSLVCRDLETGAMETWISLYYNPYGVELEDALLYPFQDVLGCSGVALLSRVEHTTGDVPTTRFFRHDGGVPDLVAKCEGELYTAQVDGFDLLLSAYPFGYDGTRGGAALYWREEDGRVFCRPLRDAVEHFLGLSWRASVSMSLSTLEEAGTLAVLWQGDDSPEHTMDLDLSALLAYARAQAARTQEVQLGCLNGDELLKLVLEERRLEDEYGWDCFEVEKIQVYRGAALIQTLLPQDWLGLAEWELYVHDAISTYNTELGQPTVLDLNGDGIQDFGLLCDAVPARNLPCLYFLWDTRAEAYVPLAVLCDPEPDPAAGQVVDKVNEGNAVTTTNWYEFDGTGGLTLVRSETHTFSG